MPQIRCVARGGIRAKVAATAALPAALDAVRHALAAASASDTTSASAPSTSAAAMPTLSAAQQHAVQTALTQLSSALAQGELPDAPLQTLGQTLPAHTLQALHQAIDRFDFSDAQRCLDTLQQQLQTPKTTAP